MDRSTKEGGGKKKINEAKTFPVPFALGEIKKKISISTNTPSQASKETIIHQAIQFHLKGNIPEATKYYQYCINQSFNDPRVLSNYGLILKDLGKLKEARLSYHKAIEIKPDYAEAHYNLGIVLKDLGKLKEAELSYRKAIEIRPDYAVAHSNLGNILRDLGKSKEAELSYRYAIEIKPDFAQAHSNLGNILRDLGKLKEAELSTRKAIEIKPDFAVAYSNLGGIWSDLGNLKDAELSYRKAIELNPDFALAHSHLGMILKDLGNLKEAFDLYLKAIDINPENSSFYTLITRFLRDSDLSQLDKSNLRNILNLLLERNDVSHKELIKAFNFVYSKEIIINLEKIYTDFSKIGLIIHDKILINALRKIIFCNVNLEILLTKIRRKICVHISQDKETINYSELQFIIALGEQCFLNEYVYSLTEEENLSLKKIINKCKDSELNETNISLLSCYFPLYKLLDQIPSLKSFNSTNQRFTELMELQILEPLKEIKLSKNIKKLGLINDDISQKVKNQYEENPYPRWKYGNHSESQKISIMQAINNEIKPNSISSNAGDSQLKVLIAGCGTGQQILHGQIYKNAEIIGIDLSLSSLSYAQRKIKELKINNVTLIQMDILEVDLLEVKFDIILCSGVLHHMDDPSKGLKALLRVLKTNGFLKLGLYSELARQNIIEARNYITSKNLRANEDNIRNFRESIFSGEKPALKSLTKGSDFYTLSSCRDLCFHIKEHRFTMKQLQDTLNSNELRFLGFLLPQLVKSVYETSFPENKKQTNLQNWEKFEEQHPSTFTDMYQFWVSKKEN